MSERPYTIRRYVYRIFIPFALLGVVGMVLRWQATREFQENNVVPVEPGSGERIEQGGERIEEEVAFSEENRAHVINGLEQTLEVLEESGRTVDEPELERLRDSIDRLGTVGEEEWRAALDNAYDALAELRQKG